MRSDKNQSSRAIGKGLSAQIVSIGLGFSTVVLSLLAVSSVVITCGNGIGSRLTERLMLTTAKSAPLASLGCAFGIVVIAILLQLASKLIKDRDIRKLLAAGFFATLLFQIWWIVSQGSNNTYFSDSRQLLAYASALSSGQWTGIFNADISGIAIENLLPGTKYLVNYPFQSGVLLYFEALYRLFGSSALFAIQLINAVANSITYVLLGCLVALGFSSKRTTVYTSMLGLVCFPLYLYATFFYGNQVGLCAAMVVLVSNLKAMRSPDKRTLLINLGLSAVFLVIMMWLKSTYVLLSYAVAILWFVKLLRTPEIATIAGAALFIISLLFSNIMTAAPQRIMSERLGYDLGEGMPKTSWIAIGLEDDSVLGDGMPGWWNRTALQRQEECNNDMAAQTESAISSIKKSLDGMLKNPGYGASFFLRKIATEWLTPDYQARYFAGINTHVDADNLEESQFNIGLDNPCENGNAVETHKDVVWSQIEALNPIMDALQSFVYVFAALGSIDLFLRRHEVECVMLLSPCCFFIGFLVFLLWEAKAQYLLAFYLLLYPLAAYGLSCMSERLVVDIQIKSGFGLRSNR